MKTEPKRGEHLPAVDRAGEDIVSEWRVVNPKWPKGNEPYMERCAGCPTCPDPANRTERKGGATRHHAGRPGRTREPP